MSRDPNLSAKSVISCMVIAACLLLLAYFAQADRGTSNIPLPDDAREIVRIDVKKRIKQIADEEAKAIEEAEEKAAKAKKDEDELVEKIELGKKELVALTKDAENKSGEQKKELQKAKDDIQREHDKRVKALQDIAEKSKMDREALAVEQLRQKKLAQSAQVQIGQSLGRGARVDHQTQFNSLRRRDPDFPAFAPNAAAVAAASPNRGVNINIGSQQGSNILDVSKAAINAQTAKAMALDNHLRGIETFFEGRRINKAARALEDGPRPTLEQVIKYSKMRLPRKLTDDQLDPNTGEITWPYVLTDSIYLEEEQVLQGHFHDRVEEGGSIGFEKGEEVNGSVARITDLMKENVSKYASGKYGEARSFMESLRYEFYLPVK